MDTEPDTAGHHLEHPTLGEHLAAFERGGAIDSAPRADPHPPGPRLTIGGALLFCAYCDSPHRAPHRRDTANQRQRNRSSATGTPGTETCAPAHCGATPPARRTQSHPAISPWTTGHQEPQGKLPPTGRQSCAVPPTPEKWETTQAGTGTPAPHTRTPPTPPPAPGRGAPAQRNLPCSDPRPL